MKVVLTPFTRYQMKSMKKMGELQPKMNALREKYKDDPQKQQQMMMKLYRDKNKSSRRVFANAASASDIICLVWCIQLNNRVKAGIFWIMDTRSVSSRYNFTASL